MKPHLEQLRVGMIGEWSHNSAVGLSVECLNIEECYVRLRLRRNLLEGRISFLALEAENNDDAVHNHNQTHNHKYAISDPIPPFRPILSYCTQLYRLPFNIFMATVVVPSTPRSCDAVPLATCPNAP